MGEKQKTIAKPISVTGKGLHTGVNVKLIFNPAQENFGIQFKRICLEDQPVIKATSDYVVATNRGTTIGINGHVVNTIEHVMAALNGKGIDNALIEIDNSETPILDGSSRYFTEALNKVGTVEQNADKVFMEINEVLTYTNAENKVELIAIPSDEFKISVLIDFETDVLSTQNASLDRIEDFQDEIANCRTFVFLHELEYLLSNNLIKGGDLSNAIVFVNREISQEELDRLAKLFNISCKAK